MNLGGQFWKKNYDNGVGDLDPELWETTYVNLVRPVFRRGKEKPALFYMGSTVTYSELDWMSNRFAHMLMDGGLKRGDVVGINLPNMPEYVIAWLGILKAGCVVTGISPLLSAEEMEFQLKDSGARGLVTLDATFESRLFGMSGKLKDLKLVVAASVGGFMPPVKRFLGNFLGKIPKGEVGALPGKKVYLFHDVIKPGNFKDAHPVVFLTPDDPAYIMYTGGTTGLPKGALLSHRNVVSDVLIYDSWLGFDKDGAGLSGFPMFHIAGLFYCSCVIFWGWPQVLVPNPRDTSYICKAMKKYKPSFIANVPSLYYLLMADPSFRKLDHSSLEICLSAAAPFPKDAMEELAGIIGEGKLLETYGMSETSPLTISNPCRGPKKMGTIGMPLPNTDVRLADPVTGDAVPVGEPGEICIKGPQVMQGYHGKPEETSNVFTRDGYLKTGDVGVCDKDGYISIVDRIKDMVNVSGFKVFSKKVEEVLSGHPMVEMAAIIGVPDRDRPGSESVVAYVTVSAEAGDDMEEIRGAIMTFAGEKLAKYEVPGEVVIVDELPVTSVGKLDKKQLRREHIN